MLSGTIGRAMFTAAFFVRVKRQKQPKCSSGETCIQNVVSTELGDKKESNLDMHYKNLGNTLSDISQTCFLFQNRHVHRDRK